ncbi:phosphoadenosine phosphosulfate reductase [Pararhodobacter sp.]|uniref:phosphoadenosine phosphosulfate reductase n=1 Tax=Pararhodobacter sp. TaxID=2127056 RepID=UPI002AFFA968|nr:phosphoadenosine phosphosulfate reductase [Pararhodobacter sp.]
MTDDSIEMFDAGEAQSDADWLVIMDEIGEEAGYFEPLGGAHSAFFSDQGPVLLVSFETRAGVRGAGGGQMPLGYQIAAPRGWSSLTIIAHEDSWFRDPAVYGYFDRLIDDAFFEDFDRVVFYGAGMGGYAAAAFAVAAPGATVLALAPQATLDTELAEWDRRFLRARKLDFTSRFGFAPDMCEGADSVYILYDPIQQVDAVHAAMFRGPHIHRLRARHIGRDPQAELARVNVLRPLIDAACAGTLTPQRFFHLWRARRQNPHYLGRLIGRLQSQDRPALVLRALRAANELVDHPQLRQALQRAETGASPAR